MNRDIEAAYCRGNRLRFSSAKSLNKQTIDQTITTTILPGGESVSRVTTIYYPKCPVIKKKEIKDMQGKNIATYKQEKSRQYKFPSKGPRCWP